MTSDELRCLLFAPAVLAPFQADSATPPGEGLTGVAAVFNGLKEAEKQLWEAIRPKAIKLKKLDVLVTELWDSSGELEWIERDALLRVLSNVQDTLHRLLEADNAGELYALVTVLRQSQEAVEASTALLDTLMAAMPKAPCRAIQAVEVKRRGLDALVDAAEALEDAVKPPVVVAPLPVAAVAPVEVEEPLQGLQRAAGRFDEQLDTLMVRMGDLLRREQRPVNSLLSELRAPQPPHEEVPNATATDDIPSSSPEHIKRFDEFSYPTLRSSNGRSDFSGGLSPEYPDSDERKS